VGLVECGASANPCI